MGPSLAVLLFARVDVIGVVWLRVASAAVIFGVWRRPWRHALRLDGSARGVLVGLGTVLAAMNTVFYLAVDRLPLSSVGAVEFLGTLLLAALGVGGARNLAALVLATLGVAALVDIRLVNEPLGFLFAFANAGLFAVYVVLGHRIANAPSDDRAGGDARIGARPFDAEAIDRLGAAMLVAAVVLTPVGLAGAVPALPHAELVVAAIGVGVCSSVVPYVVDQLAMGRLPRASFALMLSLLPMFATLIGAIVLHQIPTRQDVAGVALVVAGVALHAPETAHRRPADA